MHASTQKCWCGTMLPVCPPPMRSGLLMCAAPMRSVTVGWECDGWGVGQGGRHAQCQRQVSAVAGKDQISSQSPRVIA